MAFLILMAVLMGILAIVYFLHLFSIGMKLLHNDIFEWVDIIELDRKNWPIK